MKKTIILAIATLVVFAGTQTKGVRADKGGNTPFDKHFTTIDYEYPDGDTEMTVFIQNGTGACFILGPYAQAAVFPPKAFCDEAVLDGAD